MIEIVLMALIVGICGTLYYSPRFENRAVYSSAPKPELQVSEEERKRRIHRDRLFTQPCTLFTLELRLNDGTISQDDFKRILAINPPAAEEHRQKEQKKRDVEFLATRNNIDVLAGKVRESIEARELLCRGAEFRKTLPDDTYNHALAASWMLGNHIHELVTGIADCVKKYSGRP